MRNNKSLISLLICFSMMLGFWIFPNPLSSEDVQAATTFNTTAALAYAREHWNDGVGDCQAFVYQCARAAGLSGSATGVLNVFNWISNQTGVARQKLTIRETGSYWYVYTADNVGKISAGDVVVQYCATHGTYPHILLCGGSDSKGRVTYYAHNNPKNNQTYPMWPYEVGSHTSSCKMEAYVLHFGGSSGSNPTPVPSSRPTSTPAPSSSFSMAVPASPVTVGYHTLTWTGATECEYYEIWMSTPSNPTEHWVASTQAHSYSYNFNEVGSYSITLRGTKSNGYVRHLGYYVGVTVVAPTSTPRPTNTPTPRPTSTAMPTPGDFTANSVGTTAPGIHRITWTASSNATSYDVWIAPPGSVVYTQSYTTTNTYFDYNFTEYGTYKIQLKANNSADYTFASTVYAYIADPTPTATSTPTPTVVMVHLNVEEVEYVPGEARMIDLVIDNQSNDAGLWGLPYSYDCNDHSYASGPHNGGISEGISTYRVGLRSGNNYLRFSAGGASVEWNEYIEDAEGPTISDINYYIENDRLYVDVDVEDPSGVIVYEGGLVAGIHLEGDYSNDTLYNLDTTESEIVLGIEIPDGEVGVHTAFQRLTLGGVWSWTLIERFPNNPHANISNLTSTGVHYSFSIDLSNVSNREATYELSINVHDAYFNKSNYNYLFDFSGDYNGVTPTETPTATNTPVPTVTSAPTQPATGVEGFIARLYTEVLGREADQGGINYWVDQLNRGTTGGDAAKFFLCSEEFMNKAMSNEEFVRILYAVFFDRTPDEGGLAYWMSEVTGKGKTAVIDSLIESQEWANICGEYGIATGAGTGSSSSDPIVAFCERLYTTCLGRAGEQGGIDFWSAELSAGRANGSDAARIFFFGAEFTNAGHADTEFVTRLYRTFFNREPDAAGMNFWLGELTNGTTREAAFAAFTSCQEWLDTCSAAGIHP